MLDRSVSRRAMLQLSSSAAVAGLIPSEVLFANTINSSGSVLGSGDARIGALKDLNGYFPFALPHRSKHGTFEKNSCCDSSGSHVVCGQCRNDQQSKRPSMVAWNEMITLLIAFTLKAALDCW